MLYQNFSYFTWGLTFVVVKYGKSNMAKNQGFRIDLCCIQIWLIQYGRYLKFLVVFFFFFFSLIVFQIGGTSLNSALAETKYRCYTKTCYSSLKDPDWPLLWSNMADPIWPILEVFNHFLNIYLHFFVIGGTSQNSAYAETKYRCYTKTFHTSLEDWPLLWSNMANPIWPRIKDSVVGAHF